MDKTRAEQMIEAVTQRSSYIRGMFARSRVVEARNDLRTRGMVWCGLAGCLVGGAAAYLVAELHPLNILWGGVAGVWYGREVAEWRIRRA